MKRLVEIRSVASKSVFDSSQEFAVCASFCDHQCSAARSIADRRVLESVSMTRTEAQLEQPVLCACPYAVVSHRAGACSCADSQGSNSSEGLLSPWELHVKQASHKLGLESLVSASVDSTLLSPPSLVLPGSGQGGPSIHPALHYWNPSGREGNK